METGATGKMPSWEKINFNPQRNTGTAPDPGPAPHLQPLTKNDNLSKRSLSKYMSNAIALELSRLNSPLKFKYLRTLKCGLEIRQEGQELTSRYCGCRWCLTCNRIRTGKLINKYTQILEHLQDTHFVTLTVRNIEADTQNLKMYQREMFKHHRRVQDLLRKQGITIKGIRKYEAIPDQTLKGFRPHFHWLIDGTITQQQLLKVWHSQKLPKSWQTADGTRYNLNEQLGLVKADKSSMGMLKGELLIQLWLKKHAGISERAGQDVRKATPGTERELFKYTTKILVKTKRDGAVIPLRMLDSIFQATERVRTLSTTGFVTSKPKDPKIVFSVDWRKVHRMVSVFVPQVYNVPGSPLKATIEVYKGSIKQIAKIGNYTRKTFEYLSYKEFTEIIEGDIEEDLKGQTYKDIPEQSTVFVWKQDNWYCINTGQKLTIWYPTKLTARFIEAFDYS